MRRRKIISLSLDVDVIDQLKSLHKRTMADRSFSDFINLYLSLFYYKYDELLQNEKELIGYVR